MSDKPKLNEAKVPEKLYQVMIYDNRESSTFFESFPAINPEMALKAARHTYKGCEVKLSGLIQ